MLLNCGAGEDSWESLGLKEIQPVHLKETSPGCSWKDWSWSWNSNTLAPSYKELTHWKRPWFERGWGQEETGTTEDEMAGWHLWLHAHEFEWTLGVGDGQGCLACCDSWDCKDLDITERLNWTELNGLVGREFGCNAGDIGAAAAAAKLLQSCPTLSNPMDCSPPGSSIHGIFRERVLEWGAIAFSTYMCIYRYMYTYPHTYTHTPYWFPFSGVLWLIHVLMQEFSRTKNACRSTGYMEFAINSIVYLKIVCELYATHSEYI